MTTMQDREFMGFHKFRANDGKEYGSFEVFYEDGSDPLVKSGWYWWLAHKGCIAESAATGRYPTAEGAFLDAMESGKDNARLLNEISLAPKVGRPGNGKTGEWYDTAVEEGTRYERAFGDGNDVGG